MEGWQRYLGWKRKKERYSKEDKSNLYRKCVQQKEQKGKDEEREMNKREREGREGM